MSNENPIFDHECMDCGKEFEAASPKNRCPNCSGTKIYVEERGNNDY